MQGQHFVFEKRLFSLAQRIPLALWALKHMRSLGTQRPSFPKAACGPSSIRNSSLPLNPGLFLFSEGNPFSTFPMRPVFSSQTLFFSMSFAVWGKEKRKQKSGSEEESFLSFLFELERENGNKNNNNNWQLEWNHLETDIFHFFLSSSSLSPLLST